MLTPEQIEQRKGKITSSRIAGVLGLSPYMTPLQTWMDITGRLEPKPKTNEMKRGDMLEEMVLRDVAEELGLELVRPPSISLPELPWAGDSADGLYFEGGKLRYLGEAKTAALGEAMKYGEEGTDQVPDYVLLQAHWHLIHYPEVTRCLVPVFIGGYKFVPCLYHVDRDEELERDLLAQAKQFYDTFVATDTPPPATYGDDEVLKARWPRATLPQCTDNLDEIALWARRKEEFSRALKVAEENEDEAKTRLRELLGPYELAQGPWGKVTYKNTKDRESVDWKQIVEVMGAPEEIILKHTRITPGPRQLRVALKGDPS